jgi:hypothetical protein
MILDCALVPTAPSARLSKATIPFSISELNDKDIRNMKYNMGFIMDEYTANL